MARGLLLALLWLVAAAPAHADDRLAGLQARWATVNYDLQGEEQVAAYEALIADADRLTADQPGDAGAWIWAGIIKSSLAGVKRGLGALGLAKDARAALDKAIALDPQALDGSAYTSLGTLYFRVPGWPIGFGDDERAEELLKQALVVNPDGIDPNYFYGEFLQAQGRDGEARPYLERAAAAPDRPGRERADRGRRAEIAAVMAKLRDHRD